jgi:hypothetical protein
VGFRQEPGVTGDPEAGIAGRLEILARADWQMSLGERAVIEGLVSQLRPRLAIEIGTAAGGSLARIAVHSDEVHAIDLTNEKLKECPPNATFHLGDSKTVLPKLLADFAESGRNVDFVLVDGDHSAAGVAADLEALLDSPAIARSLILVHDSFNPIVRSGIESVRLADRPGVVGFDLDAVPGRLGKAGGFRDQLLGGFAIIVVDRTAAPDTGINLGYWSLKPDPVLVDDTHTSAGRLAAVLERAGDSSDDAAIQLDAASFDRHGLGRKAESNQPESSSPVGAATRRVRGFISRLRSSD